jgi:ribosome-associated translation inhibitor RaiA
LNLVKEIKNSFDEIFDKLHIKVSKEKEKIKQH